MKKILCIMLVFVFVFSLCGCSLFHTHSFSEATCTEPPKCECGETDGKALGHKWSDATCTEPQKCECGATQGEPSGHSWNEATCSKPKTCSICAKTKGKAVDHNYVNGKCKFCSKAKPTLKLNTYYYAVRENGIYEYKFQDGGYFDVANYYTTTPMYPKDTYSFTYNGKKYYSMSEGESMGFTYEIVGDEIVTYKNAFISPEFFLKLIVTDDGDLKVIDSYDTKYYPINKLWVTKLDLKWK